MFWKIISLAAAFAVVVVITTVWPDAQNKKYPKHFQKLPKKLAKAV